MTHWTETTIGELCPASEDIQTGPFGSQLHAHEYTDVGEVPVVPTSAVGRGRLKRIDIPKVSRATADALSRHYLKAGDIVFARRGVQAAGLSALVESRHDGWLCGTGLIRLRVPNGQAEPLFLALALSLDRTYDWIRNNAVGATMPNLNEGVIRRIPLRLPPLPTQRRIASILSAYDDLIENNTKRIKILEEMARALYREWFVHFRFPGHEKVKLVDSRLGQIPEGWEVSTIGNETTKIGSGATPRGGREAYKESGITLIRSLNIYDYRFDDDGLAFIDEDQAAKLENVVVEARDVLLNITGASVARCCMARERHLPARVNQHVAIIRADTDRIDPYYLLCTINNDEQKRQLLAFAQGGATREALTKGTIENFSLLVPERSILVRFGETAGAFLRQREVLEQMNIVLRQTRDLLLPRLISGELDVSTLPLPLP